MMRSWSLALAMPLVWAAPLHADPLPEQHLFGERIGAGTRDHRIGKRLDTRLPTRLQTRIEPRGAYDPLARTKSVITSDPTNGCTPAGGSGPIPTCPPR